MCLESLFNRRVWTLCRKRKEITFNTQGTEAQTGTIDFTTNKNLILQADLARKVSARARNTQPHSSSIRFCRCRSGVLTHELPSRSTAWLPPARAGPDMTQGHWPLTQHRSQFRWAPQPLQRHWGHLQPAALPRQLSERRAAGGRGPSTPVLTEHVPVYTPLRLRDFLEETAL